jgi:DNA-binding transcriptional LysR family regulator
MPRTSDARIGRRLRFRDLQVFFAVVECGSMAKAAAELGVTQPAVSEVIAELEQTFSVRLFDRNPQGAVPTIFGRALFKRGLAAFDELKQGMRDLEFLADPTSGEVRIGCPESIAGAILGPMVREFCREYPGVVLEIQAVPTPTLELPELHARKLDVVLARLSRPHASDPLGEDFDVRVLYDDEAVIAAGANSRWARRDTIDLAELANASWVGTPRETLTTMAMEQAFQAAGLPIPKLRVMTFSVQVRAHLLAAGDFLTAMPKSMLRLNPECAGLTALPITLPKSRFPVAIVRLKNRTLTPVVELFLDRLRSHVKSLSLS